MAGGETRSASVRAGLDAVPADATVILVHDAARPVASRSLFRPVVDAVVAGRRRRRARRVAVVDTVRRRDGEPVDRDELGRRADAAGLRRRRPAHGARRAGPRPPTMPRWSRPCGGRLRIVQGERWNLKITEPDDLLVAAALLEHR